MSLSHELEMELLRFLAAITQSNVVILNALLLQS